MASEYAGSLGFAFTCGYDGVIAEVLWTDFPFDDHLVGLSHFVSIFDPQSVQKGLALFLYVKEHGIAFGWEINLRVNGIPLPFCFSAAALENRIVILGSAASQGAHQIYEGLSQLINEQVNSLRELCKAANAPVAESTDGAGLPDKLTADIIGDMLKLNNRLVNAERDLARKNAELRRMSAVLSKDLYLAHRVLQCSGEAVVIANQARRVIDINHAYIGITGYGKSETVGAELILAEAGGGDEGLAETIWDSVKTQGLWQGECLGRRKSGEAFPKWLTISAVLDDFGETSHYVVIFSDISRLKNAEEKWQRLAFFDSLTDLPNRILFKDRLRQSMVKAHRDKEPLDLLFIDLDDFKVVNDSLGHDAGDRLLREAARRIEASIREADTICRLGGDEFTAILSGCWDELDILQVCDKIIAALNAPFIVHDNPVHIGASIGIARYPSDGDDPDSLTKNADAAMYAAKAGGRNTSRFFSKALGEKINSHLKLKAQIAGGLQRGEFLLYLQPEVELSTGKIVSMEALVRWEHPERGLVPPDEFIPVAEETGLIVELGEFVILEAIRFLRNFHDLGWTELRVGVNVSRRQLAQPHLTEFIVDKLKEQGLPGRALMVEVTESMVMDDMDNAVHVLNALKSHGIETAIDDFGTGYSSLNYLRRLPVEYLKIDKSFVADADVAPESETIIRAISAMAKSLGLKTIAEGIERSAQEAILTQMGCEMGQGYFYSKPLPYDRLIALMKSKH